jgi:hypothetical protein
MRFLRGEAIRSGLIPLPGSFADRDSTSCASWETHGPQLTLEVWANGLSRRIVDDYGCDLRPADPPAPDLLRRFHAIMERLAGLSR